MTGDALLPSIDLLLRGGVCMLLLLVAGVMARDYGRSAAGRLGAFFALGTAAYALCSSADMHARLGLLAAPVAALTAGNNVAFWLFARALFDDGFRLKPWHGALWLGLVALGLADGSVLVPRETLAGQVIGLTLGLSSLGFGLLAAAQTVSSWRDDLVERRRRLRVFIVGASAGYISLTAISNLAGARSVNSVGVSTLEAIGLVLIAEAVGWSLLRVNGDGGLFGRVEPAGPETVPRPMPVLAAADAKAVAALEHILTFDRIYRQDGLTIGALAGQLGLTEHRLRRLINQALGHRNFNVFLNGYRIADAKVALADASQAEVPVLTIALDAEFNSLGPFNRAFKAETGVTPTAYRRRAFGGAAVAEFELGQALSNSTGSAVKSA